MTRQQLIQLIERYLAGTATREEQDLLERYYEKCQQDAVWDDARMGDPGEAGQTIWQGLQQKIEQRQTVPLYRKTWVRVAIAASVIAAIAMVFWKPGSENLVMRQALQNATPTFKPIIPKQALLTLSDGSVQVLVDSTDGIIAQDGAYAIRQKGRNLSYTRTTATPVAGAQAYNMLALPAGTQYQVQLPDGSRVWLNAATALRFPLHFAPDKRLVEVQGEAYFEVAKDAARVFQVQPVNTDGSVRGTRVEVLGTHFNVEAYGDEPSIRTTLLEGKVKITGGRGADALLAPGEQAVTSGNKPLTVSRVDVERVVAWQQGLFDFKGADTRQVVQQLARWYGLQISYGHVDEALRFSGKISRRMALPDVLEILEQSGLHCTVNGKNISVGKRI